MLFICINKIGVVNRKIHFLQQKNHTKEGGGREDIEPDNRR